MIDNLKKILNRILEFWNRFTSKQKTLIISVSAAVIFTLAFLVVILNNTKYVALVTFENSADTATAKDVLVEQKIKYEVSSDGLTLRVDGKKQAEARLALGQNNISAGADTSKEDLFNNSMSTTDRERKLKEKIYLQNQIITDLKVIDGISRVSVQIDVPDAGQSILKEQKEASASICLTTTSELSEESILGVASYVATALGSRNTNNIRIIDQTGKLLFDGGTEGSGVGGMSGKATAEIRIRNEINHSLEDKVRSLLISVGLYNDAEVAANLDINLDQMEQENIRKYTENPEENRGPMDSRYYYSAENTDGVQGVPGTDSNDGTIDYLLPDGGLGSSTALVMKEEYSTSTETTVSVKEVGKINTQNSSIAIMLSKYVMYDEAAMKKQGLLKGTNFEEFQAQNSNNSLIDVDPTIVDAVAMATGIPTDKIRVLAYEVPIFYPKGTTGAATAANYLQFILAVLIVILLIFVVFMGMKPVEVMELEPELSVEALLATTKENQSLEDIEFSDKSATRKQIERFVDENPEQVALLLRNWLNDEWE